MTKIEEGKKLTTSELLALKEDLAALEEVSKEKDARIAELEVKAKAAGTRPYVLAEGIVGFDENNLPEFGAGVTVGARIGNSLMVQAGADYMFADLGGFKDFSMDSLTFRAGLGWMF